MDRTYFIVKHLFSFQCKEMKILVELQVKRPSTLTKSPNLRRIQVKLLTKNCLLGTINPRDVKLFLTSAFMSARAFNHGKVIHIFFAKLPM